MKLRQISDQLQELSNEELAAVLIDVFEKRVPAPEEQAFCKTRFFIGIASQEDISGYEDPEGVPKWGPWQLAAVARPNEEYWKGKTEQCDLFLGPLYGFAQAGSCAECGTATVSNCKRGFCPICGNETYMT